MRRIIAILQQI